MDEDELFLEAVVREKADQGDANAQYELGWRHALGAGLELDDEEAVRWLHLAAENGHALAQNNLGARYKLGDGVPEDPVEAFVWFHLAYLQGDRKAGKNRNSIAGDMEDDVLEEAKTRARAAAERFGLTEG